MPFLIHQPITKAETNCYEFVDCTLGFHRNDQNGKYHVIKTDIKLYSDSIKITKGPWTGFQSSQMS